jgi:hypothetical protein
MRVLIVVLVLLNLAVGGYFLWLNSSTSLSEEMESLHSDRISLRRSEVSVADKTGPAPRKSAGTEAICVEWRGLPGAELEHGRDAMRSLANEQPLSVTETPLTRVYWVVFPPLPSRQAALTKLGEIKALGIKDAFAINEEPLRNGISLGLGSEEFARRRVREFQSMGLTGLNIETKPKKGTGYYFVIKSEQPEVLKQLDKLRQTYPSTTLSRVDCHV